MKVFRYAAGHKACETMTAAELIELLQKYPSDIPVMATWEGVLSHIDTFSCEKRLVSSCHPDDACECLIFDVEDNRL